jgi:iron complex outermembrane recepter protein
VRGWNPRILLSLLAVSVLVSEAWAQEAAAQADTNVVELPEVLVRGARPVANPGGSGGVSARADSLSLRAVPTVEQVLRALPMTHLRTNTRGETEVTTRGSDSRQVAILLDGMPLNYAWDGRADVSVIPALAIREVTLVRGLSSLTHGPNTLGGVVELSTRHSAIERLRPAAELRTGIDELGGYGAAGSLSVPRPLGRGTFTTRVGLGHRDSPGFTLAGDLQEPVPTSAGKRLNTDLRETNGFVSLRLESDGGPFVSLLGVGHRAERGIAAQLGVTSAARFWRYPYIARGLGVLQAGTGRHDMPWGGSAELQASGGYDRGRTEIDAFDSPTYTTLASEEDGNDRVLTLRAVAAQSIGDHTDLRLAFSHGDIRHDEILDSVLREYRQRLWSAAAQATMQLPGTGIVRGFDVSGGATFDAADTPLTADKPPFAALDQWGGRFGLAAHIGEGATTVHASVSRRARFPSLRELYSGSLGTFEPNPDLEPERLLAFEGGVTARTKHASLQVVGFHHRLADAVVRIRPPGQNFQRVNQEGIRSVGAEVLASRGFGVVTVSADLTLQDVRVLDPAAGLTRPENMPEVLGSLRIAAPVAAGFHVAADARYTGEQFAIDPENDVESRLAPAGILSLELFRDWPIRSGGWLHGLRVRAAFDNVTDAVRYDGFGLPEPGRMIRAEARLH